MIKFYTFYEIAFMTSSDINIIYYYFNKERGKIVLNKSNLNRPKRLNVEGILLIIPYFKDEIYVEHFKKYYEKTGEAMPREYNE